MVDHESVRARLARLDDLLRTLDRIHIAGVAGYEASAVTRLATAHALQLAIQSCIDVGAHLIGELGLPAPGDYRGVFASLRQAGLDEDIAGTLGAAAGLRNVLVHGYLEVDEGKVWEALDRLDDLRSFARWADDLLRRQ